MAITINGNGTITGYTPVPDGSITEAKLANSAVTDSKIGGMAASKLTGALPAISGAALTGIAAGITDFDEWYCNSQITGNQQPITNWNRASSASTHHAVKGGTMSHSSGKWTFPSTGKWLIFFQGWVFNQNRAERNVHFEIETTSDNSNYSQPAAGSIGHVNFSGDGNGATHQSAACQTIFDVQDVTTHFVRFRASMTNQSSTVMAGRNYTRFIVVKLSDT